VLHPRPYDPAIWITLQKQKVDVDTVLTKEEEEEEEEEEEDEDDDDYIDLLASLDVSNDANVCLICHDPEVSH
jgi:hypothetical protein